MNTSISYTLKITEISRAIWRRVLVPSDIKLPKLHAIIRIVMGHPEAFQHFFIDDRKTIYASPAWRDLPKIRSGRNVSLRRLLSRPGDQLTYFCGDDDKWEHRVKLLTIAESRRRPQRPTCLAGKGHHPQRFEPAESGFLLSKVNRALRRMKI
jgi:hypothetical protein